MTRQQFTRQELRTLRAALNRAAEWESSLTDAYESVARGGDREQREAAREIARWQRRFEQLRDKVTTLIGD